MDVFSIFFIVHFGYMGSVKHGTTSPYNRVDPWSTNRKNIEFFH